MAKATSKSPTYYSPVLESKLQLLHNAVVRDIEENIKILCTGHVVFLTEFDKVVLAMRSGFVGIKETVSNSAIIFAIPNTFTQGRPLFREEYVMHEEIVSEVLYEAFGSNVLQISIHRDAMYDSLIELNQHDHYALVFDNSEDRNAFETCLGTHANKRKNLHSQPDLDRETNNQRRACSGQLSEAVHSYIKHKYSLPTEPSKRLFRRAMRKLQQKIRKLKSPAIEVCECDYFVQTPSTSMSDDALLYEMGTENIDDLLDINNNRLSQPDKMIPPQI